MLEFPITYLNAPVLCQSECECLDNTVIMVIFVKRNENTYPNNENTGEHSC